MTADGARAWIDDGAPDTRVNASDGRGDRTLDRAGKPSAIGALRAGGNVVSWLRSGRRRQAKLTG